MYMQIDFDQYLTQISDFVVIGLPLYRSIISGALYDTVVYLKIYKSF